MNAIVKTLALTLLLAALGFAGFHAGQFLKNGKMPTFVDLVPQNPSIQSAGKLAAVMPSVGPMWRTVTLNPISGNPDGFKVTLTPADAAEIQTGQDVVFYSLVDNRLYPVMGSVKKVDEAADRTVVHITAPQPFLDTSPTVRAHVVIVDTVSKRVPRSALLRDENDEYYVWKAVPDDTGRYAIMHQKVSAGIIGDDYVEVGYEIMMDDFVLTNPHPAIQNGETADVLVSKMNPPVHSLAQQVRDRELHDKAAAIREEVEMFKQMTQNAPQNGSCPVSAAPGGIPAAIRDPSGNGIVRAGPTGASEGCTTCSTPAQSAPATVATEESAQSTPAPTPTPAPSTDSPSALPIPEAPAAGCNGCGNSTYGGETEPPPANAPAVTQ